MFDARGDEAVDVAAEADDFFDEAGADEGEGFAGQEEDGFDFGTEAAVHEGHLEFVFVVGDGADAADDEAGAAAGGVVGEQAVEGFDADVFAAGEGFADHFGALVDGEQGGLGFVAENGDDEVIDDAGGAADDVEVAVGEGVEGSGVDGDQSRLLGGWHNDPIIFICRIGDRK